VGGQRYGTVALIPGEKFLVSAEQEAGWVGLRARLQQWRKIASLSGIEEEFLGAAAVYLLTYLLA